MTFTQCQTLKQFCLSYSCYFSGRKWSIHSKVAVPVL